MRLLSFFLLLSSTAFGWDNVLNMQERLERRLAPVVKQFDPKAMVYVNVKTKEMETELPGTPFLYEDYVVEDVRGEVVIERVDILLYSDMKELPPSFRPFVREVTGPLAKHTLIRLRPIPADLAPKPATAPTRDIAKETTEPKTRSLASVMGGSSFSRLAVVLIGLMCLLVFMGVWQTVWMRSRQLQDTVEVGVERLISTLQPPSTKESNAPFATLSEKSWGALITDCYWGEFDAYGSFLWKRMPTETRRALVEKFPFLAAYGSVLSHAAEEDFGSHSEPYYLAPMNIETLNNDDVTTLARKHPELLLRLSSLRLAGLKLSPKERMTLTKSAMAGGTEPMPRLEGQPASAPRRFVKASMVAFLDEKQEAELMGMADTGPEVAAWMPSLTWFDRLGDERSAKILARFSARELAAAWVGPKQTLERLEGLMPGRKRRLLNVFRRTTTPQRTSPSFYQLHRDAVTALAAQKPERTTSHAKTA